MADKFFPSPSQTLCHDFEGGANKNSPAKRANIFLPRTLKLPESISTLIIVAIGPRPTLILHVVLAAIKSILYRRSWVCLAYQLEVGILQHTQHIRWRRLRPSFASPPLLTLPSLIFPSPTLNARGHPGILPRNYFELPNACR